MHDVVIEQSASATIVRGSGELDAFAAPDLAAAFLEVRGAASVLADLERVSFMDSTALGVIVRGVRTLDEEGARVQIVLPRGPARRIFEITTLDRALPVAATPAEALAALAP
ncbi:MAG TPA: STAS domain-containing protein [Gaiellaceae bacterium]|nr:STAS domain-containing protein [Gaiellaceae bacterium]